MPMPGLLEASEAKAAGVMAVYYEAVERAARKRDIFPDEVLKICDDTPDRSPLDFQNDLEACEERIELAEKLATMGALQTKADTLESAMNARRAAFAILAKKHSDEIQAMQMDFNTLAGQLFERPLILRKLRDLAPAHLVAEVKVLQTERSRLAPRLTEIQSERQSMQNGSLNAGKLGLERQLEQAREAGQKLSGSKNSKANLAAAETALANFMANRWEPAQAEAERIKSALAETERKLAAIENQILSGGV